MSSLIDFRAGRTGIDPNANMQAISILGDAMGAIANRRQQMAMAKAEEQRLRDKAAQEVEMHAAEMQQRRAEATARAAEATAQAEATRDWRRTQDENADNGQKRLVLNAAAGRIGNSEQDDLAAAAMLQQAGFDVSRPAPPEESPAPGADLFAMNGDTFGAIEAAKRRVGRPGMDTPASTARVVDGISGTPTGDALAEMDIAEEGQRGDQQASHDSGAMEVRDKGRHLLTIDPRDRAQAAEKMQAQLIGLLAGLPPGDPMRAPLEAKFKSISATVGSSGKDSVEFSVAKALEVQRAAEAAAAAAERDRLRRAGKGKGDGAGGFSMKQMKLVEEVVGKTDKHVAEKRKLYASVAQGRSLLTQAEAALKEGKDARAAALSFQAAIGKVHADSGAAFSENEVTGFSQNGSAMTKLRMAAEQFASGASAEQLATLKGLYASMESEYQGAALKHAAQVESLIGMTDEARAEPRFVEAAKHFYLTSAGLESAGHSKSAGGNGPASPGAGWVRVKSKKTGKMAWRNPKTGEVRQ